MEAVKECGKWWDLAKQWLTECLLFCSGILSVKCTWLMDDEIEGKEIEVGRGEETKVLRIERNEWAVFIGN